VRSRAGLRKPDIQFVGKGCGLQRRGPPLRRDPVRNQAQLRQHCGNNGVKAVAVAFLPSLQQGGDRR